MKLWGTPILFFLFSIFASFFFVPKIQADVCNIQLNSAGSDEIYTLPSESITFSSSDVRAPDGDTLITNSNGKYFIEIAEQGGSSLRSQSLSISNGFFSADVTENLADAYEARNPLGGPARPFNIRLMKNTGDPPFDLINREVVCSATVQVRATEPTEPEAQYSCNIPQAKLSRIGTEIVNVAITLDASELAPGRNWWALFRLSERTGDTAIVPLSKDGNAYTGGIQSNFWSGDYTLAVSNSETASDITDLRWRVPSDHQECISGFTIPDPITQLPEDEDPDFCPVGEDCDDEYDETPFELCRQAGEANFEKCNTCFTGGGIWTAVGCIPYTNNPDNPDATQSVTLMLRSFITIGLGIAGGVVVLMVLAGSFLLSTSQGDPKRVDEGKSLISSAVIGILFIIFSVSILRFIGVDILQIPGFGR